MTRLQTTSGFVVALCLAIVGVLALRKSPATLEIPAALQSEAAEIPAEHNNLTRFLASFETAHPEQTRKLREALERLESGKCVKDETLLSELLRIHTLANELLRPPLAFSQSEDTVSVELFRVFQGAEVLARQAICENDYAKADRIIGDLLRWSRLLRNGQPNEMQWIISRSGWKMAFDALLQDLPGNPDQSKRLGEIERLFRENRIETAELIECLKMEARWRKATGGLKALLDEPDAYMMTVFLKPPFDDISSTDLRTLPYDVQADFQRDMSEMLGILNGLKRSLPISSWPGFEVLTTERTLEDYRKRPNGLGDLFYEQRGFAIQNGFWTSALSYNRLMEACLLWLKQERKGADVSEKVFRGFLDPVDGKAMSIDIERRTIRSRGPNMEIDPQDPDGKPMTQAGFHMSGDDVVIVVPRWKAASAASAQ